MLRFEIQRVGDVEIVSHEGADFAHLVTATPAIKLVPHAFLPTFDVLRWTLPLVLSRCGYIVLHASAVRREQHVLAFLGPGDAGKSTLARSAQADSDGELQLESDDCLICRSDASVVRGGEAMLRAYCQRVVHSGEALADATDLARELDRVQARDALRAVVFVGPREDSPHFAVQPMPPAEALAALIRAGYGGAFARTSWGTQVDAYAHLVESAEIGQVHPPRGVPTQAAALRTWLRATQPI